MTQSKPPQMPLARLVIVLIILVVQLARSVSTQPAPLRILSATPQETLSSLADGAEIRIAFSEPMIAIGSETASERPPWLDMTPAVAGRFYWSGTRTLVFAADDPESLPFATRFSIRIDATATSVSGRALGTPYAFGFTTPTVVLVAAAGYRPHEKTDDRLTIVLDFNQAVRAADVLAHTSIRYQPFAWTAPELEPRARQWLADNDPAGLAAFDTKVAAVRGVTQSTDAVPFHLAATWDERRYPPGPARVVLETDVAPRSGGRLAVRIDDRLSGVQGAEHHAAQSSVLTLAQAFFVTGPRCTAACDPESFTQALGLSVPVMSGALRSAITVREEDGTPIMPSPRSDPGEDQLLYSAWSLLQLGYPQQPPMRTRMTHIDSSLVAADGETLGYPFVAIMENGHAASFTTTPAGVWEASAGPRVPIWTRNVALMHEWIAPIAVADLPSHLDHLLQWPMSAPPVAAVERRLVNAPDRAGTYSLDLSRVLSPHGTGLVWLSQSIAGHLPGISESPRSLPSGLLQVTNLGITLKHGPYGTLAFVTRLDDGTPVAGASIAALDAPGHVRWRGVTDQHGIATSPELPDADETPEHARIVVTAEKDGDVAFAGDAWSPAMRSYGRRTTLVASGFVDRGAYRPGDEVHLKLVIRRESAKGLALLAPGTNLEIRLIGTRDLGHQTVVLNDWSAAECVWSLPRDAALGTYSFLTTVIGRSGEATPSPEPLVITHLLVAEFRRPDFEVVTTLAGAAAIAGDSLKASVTGRFLFGSPLRGQPVQWSVQSHAEHSVPAAVSARFSTAQYAFGSDEQNWSPDQPMGDSALDAAGRFTIDIPTAAGVDEPYSYEFEAEVTGPSGQHIAHRTSVVVPSAAIHVGVSRPHGFVSASTGADLSLVVADAEGTRLPRVVVTFSLLRHELASPVYPGRRTDLSWRTVATWTATSTAEDAVVHVPVTTGGSYLLRATADDARGRHTRTELNFYATGPGRVWAPLRDRAVDVVPERDRWAPGETAHVMLLSPWTQATALVTVERERVLRREVVPVTSAYQRLDVPITEDDVPGVRIAVTLVKGRTGDVDVIDATDSGAPDYRTGSADVVVDAASKRLSVAVTTDRQTYRPRAPMTIAVDVKDSAGRPTPAEVSLWAVDAGLVALTRFQPTDLVSSLYANRSPDVWTFDTRDRLIHRIATKGASGGVALRTPVVVTTDVVDTASTQVAATITADQINNLPLVTKNALNFVTFLQGVGSSPAVEAVRADFRPVLWVGSLTTDAAGHVTATVTLPDSLTTYRIFAVAGDRTSRFGTGSAEAQVSKPLALLPTLPRFARVGDRLAPAVVVANAGRTSGTAAVSLQGVESGPLRFGGSVVRRVHLNPGESRRVSFDGMAVSEGIARVVISATLGEERDSVVAVVPISSTLQWRTSAGYGEATTGGAAERLLLPSAARPDAGELTVQLSSTALVGLGAAATYLDEYPYLCAEQRASRALALMLMSELGATFQVPGATPAEYRTAAQTSLTRLADYACLDGSTALWPGACAHTSPYLTAYVLHVLDVGRAMGFVVEESRLEAARAHLSHVFAPQNGDVESWAGWALTQAYVAKVLGESGATVPETDLDALMADADRLPASALSWLADALAASGDHGPRYRDVIRRLMNATRVSGNDAHVEEEDELGLSWLWDSNVRATAGVLEGFARRKDDATLPAPMARWLLSARRNGRWDTTHENAAVLEALVAYYRAFEANAPDLRATVTVAGRPIGSAEFHGRSAEAKEIRVPMPDLRTYLSAATSDLLVATSGTGRAYYATRLRYLAPESIEPSAHGIRVERSYEPYVVGQRAAAATTFALGDIVRVRIVVTVTGEGRYLALTDPLPAGFELIDELLDTTSRALADDATAVAGPWWRPGFDHVEKRDDRFVAFATRLAGGRHELSYLARATTAGVYTAPATRAEAMYQAEVSGQSGSTVIIVK